MRCAEFYEKWRRCGNFCEKDPRTAEQIDAYLDEILRIEEKVADCCSEREIAAFAEMEISETALRPITSEKDEKIHDEEVQQIVELMRDKITKGEETKISDKEIKKIVHICNPSIHFSSDSPEWYTPIEIIEMVQLVLGEIDLDPCSNIQGEPNVPAKRVFTEEDDGLTKEWQGKVYMNPPYGDEIGSWITKLVKEHECGNVPEAIALVPSRTDTKWFQELRAYPRCFIWGRLKFSNCDNSAPFPSALIYLGTGLTRFKEVFGQIGDTYVLA